MAPQLELDLAEEFRLLPTFAELPQEALGELVAGALQRRVHAGVSVVEQGAVAPSVVVLLRGAVKASRAADARTTVILDVLRAPALLLDPSTIDGRPAAASVVTLRSSHIATIDRRVVFKLFGVNPQFARALLARAAQDLRAQVRRLDEIVAGPVDERVKRLLESLAEQHGTPLGQGRFIAIPLRRRDLACMVNATTETVSRLLAKFEREGLVRSTRDGLWWKVTPSSSPPPASTRPSDRVAPGR